MRLVFQAYWIRISILQYVFGFKIDIAISKLTRAFNFENFLEKVEDVFEENGESNTEILNILLNEEYQRLFRQTFLSDSEVDLINNGKNLQNATLTECWLLKVNYFNSDCQI